MKTMLDDFPLSSPYWQDLGEGETSLVHAARQGELDAFNIIVLKYQDALFRTALSILDQEDAAADATQDAFISAYQHFDQFRGGSLKSWLVRIVINKCYDSARRRQSHVTVSLHEMNDDHQESENEQVYSRLQDRPESIEAGIEARQTRDFLMTSVSSLPADFRIVVTLVDIEEMSYEETAAALKIPVGTVKSRLARARDQLRHKLKACQER